MALKSPIISLSLPKSGTTTLAHALRHAGLRVADWRVRRTDTDRAELHGQLVAQLMYEDYFASGDPLKRLDQFQAVTEMNAVNDKVCYWPQMDFGLLSAIADHHPDARFIMSMRDPVQTARSMMNWNSLGKRRLPKNNVPGLPRPFCREEKELVKWIEGHYTFCMRIFHNMDTFLAYDLEAPDIKETVGDFIGVSLPWWGKANVNEKAADVAAQEG